MKKSILNEAKGFLPTVLLASMIFGTIYITVQQNYRTTTNDPQIQYVEGISRYLSGKEAKPEDVTGTDKIDVKNSLDPFIIIFDTEKKSVASSVELSGGTPIPDSKSFDFEKNQNKLLSFLGSKEQNRFTWEPQKGIKIAAVLDSYEKDGKLAGYILTGRNLREIENRINNLRITVFAGWLLTLILVFITNYLKTIWGNKNPDKK